MKALITLLFALLVLPVFSQEFGTLRGKIETSDTKEPAPFVKIIVSQNEKVIGGATSDFDGKYIINNLPPGKYDVKFKSIEYEEKNFKGVYIYLDKITFLDVILESSLIEIEEVKVVSYCVRGARMQSSPAMYDIRSSEQYNTISDNQFTETKADALSTFSIDVDKASYSNVRRFLNNREMPPENAVRIEEMINYFNYDYQEPKDKQPFSVSMHHMECPWNKQNELVHIGIKGKSIDPSSAPANNLVFLVDVSGSMNSPDKLDLLKRSLYLLVDQMRAKDRISIVVYAGAAGVALPSTSGKQKAKIKGVIESLNAGGSTAGGQGIKLAYKIAKKNFIRRGNNRVILATDGDFNVGLSDQEGLIELIEEKRDLGIYLSVLGLGTGNLQDGTMEQIANKGNGNYYYIDRLMEAKKVLIEEMGGTLITIAKDVKIQVEFNPLAVKEYRLIGYVNRLMADQDFDDDTKDAGELGAGHMVTAIYEIVPNKTVLRDDERRRVQSRVPMDLLTLNLRYKEPKKEASSLLISEKMQQGASPFKTSAKDIQFASAVASFGMLLRDSEQKGTSTYDSVIEIAERAKGDDPDGYRREFIEMVKTAKRLAD